MECKAEHAEGGFDKPVKQQRPDARLSEPANNQRTGAHAAHEKRQHQHLRVRSVAEKEAQVARPARLVDQSSEAGKGEDRVQRSKRQGGVRDALRRGVLTLLSSLRHQRLKASAVIARKASMRITRTVEGGLD